jgi:nucleoside-diphosphate-sugar epimerase
MMDAKYAFWMTRYYDVNVNGTFNILEAARNRNKNVKVVLIGTCMVYDLTASKAISEEHYLNPKSPYAGSKLAAENLALSYYHAYGLPVVITRPFNTYGPYQKSDMEGGVVSIFVKSLLEGETLNIFGDGTQTRDLLYVEDCAEFIVKAAFTEKAVGEVINGGYGHDIAIKDLALLICKDPKRIKHVKHHHPQSEIPKLLCDYTKAKKFLGGWEPKTSLEEGIDKTKAWIRQTEQ